jgi:hypothetical protein
MGGLKLMTQSCATRCRLQLCVLIWMEVEQFDVIFFPIPGSDKMNSHLHWS